MSKRGAFKARLVRHERALVIAAGAILLTAFLMNLEFNWIESALYDFRMRTGSQPTPSEEIILISVDDRTLTSLDELAPVPLEHHVKLLEQLEANHPKAIGYLVDMNRVAQTYADQVKTEWGGRFVSVASRMESKGIPFILGTPFDINGEVVPPYPLSAVPHAVSVIHKDGNVFG